MQPTRSALPNQVACSMRLQDRLIDVHMRNMAEAFKHRHACTRHATCMDVDCVKSTTRRTHQRLRDNFQRWLRKNIVCHEEFAKCEDITRKLLPVTPLIGPLQELLRHTYRKVFGWDRGGQWSSLLPRDQPNKQNTNLRLEPLHMFCQAGDTLV
jgi:hypothetical protein